MWMIFWHDVVPRLVLILYITSLGVVGTSAAVLIAGLSVFCIVGLVVGLAQSLGLTDMVRHMEGGHTCPLIYCLQQVVHLQPGFVIQGAEGFVQAEHLGMAGQSAS